MFSFVALIIHSILRTDHKNPNINMTSSYVDLAPLYGNDQATEDQVPHSHSESKLTTALTHEPDPN